MHSSLYQQHHRLPSCQALQEGQVATCAAAAAAAGGSGAALGAEAVRGGHCSKAFSSAPRGGWLVTQRGASSPQWLGMPRVWSVQLLTRGTEAAVMSNEWPGQW